jgi:hypothetical protein
VGAILARQPERAAHAMRTLIARGTRGRSVDADRATVEAGISGMAGDRERALAGYRVGLAGYRELSLAYDEALLALQAATVLGADEPEVAGWVEEARAILRRLRAAPVLAQLELIVAASRPSRAATQTTTAVESQPA